MCKLISFFFAVTLLSNSLAANCNKKQTLKKLENVLTLLKEQTKTIEYYLAGSKTDPAPLRDVFGRDFDVAKTDQKIQELKNLRDKQDGINIEKKSLKKCLSSLKLESENQKLKESSKYLADLKIKLLLKNKDLSDSLRSSALIVETLPEMKDQIIKDKKEAANRKSNLEDQIIKNQLKDKREISSIERKILEYEKDFAKINIELLDLKIEFNKNLEKKINYFERFNSDLQKLSVIPPGLDNEKLNENYNKIEGLWLSLSQENYYDLISKSFSLELPKIPEIKFDKQIEVPEHLIELKKTCEQLRSSIIKNYSEKKNQELKLLNQLVTTSGAIRERYFEILGSEYFFDKLLNAKFIKLIQNEIISAPYRVISYFYSKYLYVREQVYLGKEGYLNILTQVLYLLFVIGFFSFLRFIFQRFNSKVDHAFSFFFQGKRRSYLLKRVYLGWSKLKDSSGPFLWLITLHLLKQSTYLEEFSLLIEGAEIYFAAAILRSFVTIFLGSVSRLDMGSFISFKKKAKETSDRFVNIFLFYFYTMLAIEIGVGKVYLYSLVHFVVIIYLAYHFIKESSRWEKELAKYAEKMFSGVIVENYFKVINFAPKRLKATLLFLFIFSFMIVDFFISLTENLEVSKKISANLFKKQIENIEAEDGADDKIPFSYKDHFDLQSLKIEEDYVSVSNNLEEKVTKEIKEWFEGVSDEHSLVVYGDKGIGKTTLLKKVSEDFKKEHEVELKYVKVPSKTLTKKELHHFINSIFKESSLTGDFSIYDYDNACQKKTVIVMDEAQNVFLSQTEGFEAYYELVNIINLNTENIFWLMSFNKYSWLYLDRAFGRSQFFRNVFNIPGWSDVKIKELIMKRHEKSKFRLSYDLLISATRSQDEIDKYASIESKFFKLLWELSRGNPRSAIHLWMSALSRSGMNTLSVNIPKEKTMSGLEKMPEELMFVIANVLRHENLSSTEIESSTNFPKGVVRNSIKHALEKKFLYKDDRGRYMVDISTQYVMIKYLKAKNFIYGS